MGPQPARERVSIEDLHEGLAELRSRIVGDPDSDEHRLRYAASWREIEGADPERADLIELQVEMGRMTPFGEEWLRRAHRCDDLLLRKKAAWAPRWSAGARMSSPVFLRGFVECVTVSLELMETGGFREWLFRVAPIRHLNLVGCPSEDAFAAFVESLSGEERARLVSLHLDGQKLGDRAMAALAGIRWERLQWLSLAHNEIGEFGVEALAKASWKGGALESLVYVNLTGNPADPVDRVSLDEGVLVDVSTPEIQGRLTDARWMHAPIADGELQPVVRFRLRSRASEMAAGLAG